MRVCDVVMNSIWFDPRVNRQISEYMKDPEVELTCVGLMDNRHDASKIKAYGCPITIVEKPAKYNKKLRTPIGKIIRENIIIGLIADAIMKNRPDIIHANDLDALRPAMLAAKTLKCKVVYDAHEIYVENPNLKNNYLYRKYLEIHERRLIKKVSLMVSVSHGAAEYFAKKYGIKPMVITNCALRQERPLGDAEKAAGFEVLNHGAFSAGRGYELCASAGPYLKDYPDIQVVIRGLGSYEAVIRQAIIDSHSEKNVRMAPPVTVQELIPMAARSHVGVAITEPICLNFMLSVSNKLFEYAAAGLPVIMSDIPEHRYLNKKYNFGIIIQENTPKALAEAAIQLYSDQALYVKYRENALRLAEELNWEAEFARLLDAEKNMTG